MRNKLAIIIPTKDRPQELTRALAVIKNQSFLPDQLIVVDGSDNPIDYAMEDTYPVVCTYVRVRPPGLTRQKNAGVAAVAEHINVLCFMDDDIVLEEGSLEAMMEFWESADSEIGGASFNLMTSDPPDSKTCSFFKRLFFIQNDAYGKVHKSGFNTSIWQTDVDRSVDWLGGGYTVWRKEVFNFLEFDEWFEGSGLWEDVHFSYRARKIYKLALVARAKALHIEQPISSNANIRLGKTQIINWIYFVTHNEGLSSFWCVWACFGRILVNIVKGLGTTNKDPILRAMGNVQGLCIVAGRSLRLGRK